MEQNPPGFLQGRTDHSAELFRHATYSWTTTNPWGYDGGVLMPPLTNFLVQPTAPTSMAVNVQTGEALVPGSVSPNSQKNYYVRNDAPKVMTIAPSSGSSYRIDWIMLVVEDGAYSGTNNQWSIRVVNGTTNGPPASVPANSLQIAAVMVPAGAGSIQSSNITDARRSPIIRQGIYPTDSAHTPSNPIPGQTIFRNDTPSTYLNVYNGAAWSPVANFHLMSAQGPAGGNSGSIPANVGDATVQYLTQAGSAVVTTNASGGFGVNFPVSFPHGTLTVLATVGDVGTGLVGFVGIISSQVGVDTFGGIITSGDENGGPYTPHAGGARVNWLAIGW